MALVSFSSNINEVLIGKQLVKVIKVAELQFERTHPAKHKQTNTCGDPASGSAASPAVITSEA